MSEILLAKSLLSIVNSVVMDETLLTQKSFPNSRDQLEPVAKFALLLK